MRRPDNFRLTKKERDAWIEGFNSGRKAPVIPKSDWIENEWELYVEQVRIVRQKNKVPKD